MCDLVTGLAIASSAASIGGQAMAGRAQAKSIGRNAKIRAQQAGDAATERLGQRVKEARARRARARVAAGEAGVGGQSFEMMLQDSIGQQNRDAAKIAKNARWEAKGIRSAAAAKTAGLGVNGLTAAAHLGSAGLSGYSQSLQIQSAKKALQIPD